MAPMGLTPGSWQPKYLPPNLVEVRSDDTDIPVVSWMGFDDDDRDIEEHRANACIMAASKDLYAALKALTTLSPNGRQICFSTQNGIPMGMSRKQEKLVRAALAKAEGR